MPAELEAGPSRGGGRPQAFSAPGSARSQSRGARNSPITIDSDEEEDIMRASRSVASSSRAGNGPPPVKLERKVSGATHEDKEALRVRLTKLDSEIKSVAEQLKPLQHLHSSLTAERRTLEAQLSSLFRPTQSAMVPHQRSSVSSTIDYQSESFPWSTAAMAALKSTFGMTAFRLCQEGVINAAMDSRDIVCVMPTGGGKSLTYQLPAIAGARGLTVVISPLLALIWDQVRALKELGVECAMLTGSTSKEEQNAIYKQIEEGSRDGKELRLCYLTPEKVSKSKRLMSVLEKANAAGRLKRFVIDEAHCCSQLGHDFRPDYKKLSVLKTLFPRVPIQAVTATLSSKTMPDLLKILRLPPICDGRAANTTGTVFFSAPLFRPNLHYRVLSKPSSAKATIEKMGQWINENHAGQSGIIYCFSKKDAETVAESLTEWSEGAIKTGVYHAGIEEWEKERIHVNWRKGKVNCICATIAFGLGIDKGDVRYVIHHSMSKSLEGYYQETGRAGRDGKDSDCVLFYRGQDASRLSSMIYGDVDGTSKLQEMLRFAQDLKTCRKVAFAKYFSTSSNLSAAAWDQPDALGSSSGTITTCGICDNCTRDPSTITTKDVTIESWKVLKVMSEVVREGGRVTLANLSDLVRGLGGGGFAVPSTGKRKREPEKANLSVDDVAGGKVTFSKDDTEALLIQLILLGYLEDSYSATAYSVNVYVVPGPKALRLSRLSMADVQSGNIAAPIECTFPNPESKPKATRKKGKKTEVEIDAEDPAHRDPKILQPKEPRATKKTKTAALKDFEKEADEMEDIMNSGGWEVDDLIAEEFDGVEDIQVVEDSSDVEESGWKVVRGGAAPRSRF